MSVNQDFKELFVALNDAKVEYLIVGAHAVIHYAEPRYTKDLDIWINPTPANAERIMAALAQFGAPLDSVAASDFADPELVFQIGIEPNRIDILMGVKGVAFADAYLRRQQALYDDVPIGIIGKLDLIKTKRAIGRAQDLLDLERLEEKSSRYS